MNTSQTARAGSAVALPGPQDIHVWLCAVGDAGSGRIAVYESLLSSDELQRMQRLRLSHLRERFLIARALARTTLSRYYPDMSPAQWAFTLGDFGKPQVLGLPIRFNLSHAGDWVILAVRSGAEVGVDVEEMGAGSSALGISEQFFAPSECAWLYALDECERSEGFLSLWTLKEAYLKARGTGLSAPLSDRVFDLSALPRIAHYARSDGASWEFTLASLGARYRLSLAAATPPRMGAFSVQSWRCVPLAGASPWRPQLIGSTGRIRWD